MVFLAKRSSPFSVHEAPKRGGMCPHGLSEAGNLMQKAFAPGLFTVSLTGLVASKEVGPGATMADTEEEEEVGVVAI